MMVRSCYSFNIVPKCFRKHQVKYEIMINAKIKLHVTDYWTCPNCREALINKQGPQNHRISTLNSLKSLKFHNPPPVPAILTPLAIRNGFFIKF